MTKKYLIIAFVVSAGVAFGVFSFAPASKMIYVKSNPQYLASADINQTINKVTEKISDLTNTSIPSINAPKNLTEDLGKVLIDKITAENSAENLGVSEDSLPKISGLAVPNVDDVAKEYITNGLQQANKNILNIKSPKLKISSDNSRLAIKKYSLEFKSILENNLKSQPPLFSVLDELSKNNGAEMGKLLPIISAYETIANQLEEITVPSDLKDLITEEIRLARITANLLRALTNVENDPLGTLVAIKQFEIILQNWEELQAEFNAFAKKINTAQ